MAEEFTPQDKRKLEIASGIVNTHFPYLGGILAQLDIRFDERVGTAAVTGSGKLLFAPEFFRKLAPGVETAFILGHELLHLAQMCFERGKHIRDPEAVNIAHDILINELLCRMMSLDQPPCGALSWKWFVQEYCRVFPSGGPKGAPGRASLAADAASYSLEELVRLIREAKLAGGLDRCRSWILVPEGDGGFSNNPFADIFGDSGGSGDPLPLDMVPDAKEAELFPDEDHEARRAAGDKLRKACRDAAARSVILSSIGGKGKGSDPGGGTRAVDIVRSFYVPPWQMAMQSWFDGVAAVRRSYARASRRGAWRSDVILPGRGQEFYILHLVLDTSGSMGEVIPAVLGLIAAFARNVGMEQLHIVQCDAAVTKDEFVDIERLEKYQVAGYGGSDMSPALLKLAEDPAVTSVLVVTDGCIDYPPPEQIPYDVLWCIPGEESPQNFPYGKTVCVPVSS